MRETSWGGYKWQIPTLILMLVIIFAPFGIMLYYSTLGYSFTDTSLQGQFIGVDNYRKALHDGGLGQSVVTTLVFILGALPVQFLLGLMIAMALAQQIWLKKYTLPLLIIPVVTADVVIGLIGTLNLNPDFGVIGITLREMGLQGAILGNPRLTLLAAIVIDIWQWTPFVILIFLAALLSLSKESYEAANVDGANGWQIFWRVTLPLLWPFFIIIFLLRFTDAFKIFDKIFIMTGGGPGVATEAAHLRFPSQLPELEPGLRRCGRRVALSGQPYGQPELRVHHVDQTEQRSGEITPPKVKPVKTESDYDLNKIEYRRFDLQDGFGPGSDADRFHSLRLDVNDGFQTTHRHHVSNHSFVLLAHPQQLLPGVHRRGVCPLPAQLTHRSVRGAHHLHAGWGSLSLFVLALQGLRRQTPVLLDPDDPHGARRCDCHAALHPSGQAKDPVRMTKLGYLQFHYNLSDREVLKQVQVNVAFRHFLDLSLDSALATPELLSQFRTRLGEQRYHALFEKVIAQAREKGLVKDRLRLKDATHIIANIAVPSAIRLVGQTRQRILESAKPYAAEQVAQEEARATQIRKITDDFSDAKRLLQQVVHLRQIVTWADELQKELGPVPNPPGRVRQRFDEAMALAHRVLEQNEDPGMLARANTAPRLTLVTTWTPAWTPIVNSSQPWTLRPPTRMKLLTLKTSSKQEERAHGNDIQAISMDGIGFRGDVLRSLKDPWELGLEVFVPPRSSAASRHPILPRPTSMWKKTARCWSVQPKKKPVCGIGTPTTQTGSSTSSSASGRSAPCSADVCQTYPSLEVERSSRMTMKLSTRLLGSLPRPNSLSKCTKSIRRWNASWPRSSAFMVNGALATGASTAW